MQRATLLMGMARSWTSLANQITRLEMLMKEEARLPNLPKPTISATSQSLSVTPLPSRV
jgi:hypothetical protein